MTPFDAMISNAVTSVSSLRNTSICCSNCFVFFLLLIFNHLKNAEIEISFSFKAVTVSVSSKSNFLLLPDKTWFKRMFVKESKSTLSIETPSRYSSKAALVGANTV